LFRRATSALPRTRPPAARFDRLGPLRYPCDREERWPSGRRRTPGKCVTPNRVRGFDKIAWSDFGRAQRARRARAGMARVNPTLAVRIEQIEGLWRGGRAVEGARL